MASLFDELTETELLISSITQKHKINLKENHQILIKDINKLPHFLWHRLFSEFGINRKQNSELIKFINSKNGSILKTSGWTLLKDRGAILISDKIEFSTTHLQIKKSDKRVELSDGYLELTILDSHSKIEFSDTTAHLDFDQISFPLTLNNWKKGDKITPLGMKGTKLISDVLINRKRNMFQKKEQLLISSNGTAVWLVDLMVSDKFAIKKKTKNILKIEHFKY